MQTRVTVNQVNDNTCVKVYNPEKQEMIAVYRNPKHAANKLGVTLATVQHAVVRKSRFFSPSMKMTVAVRLAAIKDGDKELMKHCDKFLTIKPLETTTV
jgi:hypothetical protein